jgi:hypothetical protein
MSELSISIICSDISGHLRDLEPLLGTEPFRPDMGMITKMKIVLKQAEELLASELIAKALTEVNRKIASSLQTFMVRLRFLHNRVQSHETIRCSYMVTYASRKPLTQLKWIR